MNKPGRSDSVLRNVTLHAQPRVLARHGRAGEAAVAPANARPLHTVPVMPIATARDAAPALPEEVYVQARERGLREGRQQGLEEGRCQGREEGLQQGLRDAERRLDAAADAARAAVQAEAERAAAAQHEHWAGRQRRLDAITASFESSLQAHLAALQVDAVALAFEVVCRVLGEGARRERVEAMVAQAIATLRSSPLRVRLGAADLALIADDSALRQRHPRIEWLADERVVAGGCMIDSTGGGTLDARLDAQLQRLLQSWRDSGLLGDAARDRGLVGNSGRETPR